MAILGASGYTGAELMRLLSQHQHTSINVLTADRSAGLEFHKIYPQFSYMKNLPKLTKWEDNQEAVNDCDVVFCCLPHGTTQEIISILAKSSKAKVCYLKAYSEWICSHMYVVSQIVDLSADFRLKDIASYEQWYGKPHAAVELQKEAVYGLTEVCIYL